MGTYIVYRLDGIGKIRGAEWIEARSDPDALTHAARLAEIGGCEVWQRDRRVGKVSTRRKAHRNPQRDPGPAFTSGNSGPRIELQ